MVSVPRLPKDCTIKIYKCKEVVLSSIKDCSSLSSSVHLISGISSSMFLAEGFVEGFSKVEKLDIVAYDEPTSFLKSGIHSLQEFTIEMLFSNKIGPNLFGSIEERLQRKELPGRCQYLILEGCRFPVKLEQALQSLCFLRGLTIRESKEIKFFPEACLPSQLRFIDIDQCDAVQSLPMAWMHSSNTSLEELSITNCYSLRSIARVQLPSNLKRLEIKYCSNLLTLLDEEEVSGSCCRSTSCLEKLITEDCPSLTSLWSSSGNLPKALRYLSITKCSKLESIAKGFHDNTKLEKLYIVDCEKLETLPSGINNLISLKKLTIAICPAMVSVPEGGFPTSLTVFAIGDTKMCKSLFEWGLHRLMSLELLLIGGCLDVISFPQEETGMILPSSLTGLGIVDFPNLERLSFIAQNLTCLENLYLSDCSNLKYFPDDGLP
ncbi:hypothetical protein EZV62_017177 [Acer yangbiense]|uniref:Disease resistance protein At4g27190-like leucine-rich repeats domain-containing protein n=1 Tax=Acer yangbiense TaxID=1000413 RepID=A0A5C7HFT3_9ROSI|nr:hypothetical protein EZV62_017177 [Acer yangbiense]